MRILYYNPVINEPVGAGSHGRGLAGALEQAGHNVMTIPRIIAKGGALRESAGRFSAVPEWLKVPARDMRGRMRAVRVTTNLAREVGEFAPELLVVRRVPNDYSLDAVVAAARCTVIAECNGIAALESSAYYKQVTLPWEKSAEKRFYLTADGCVAITAEVSAELQGIGVDAKCISVIHNGVDTNEFSSIGPVDDELAAWGGGFEVVIGYCAKVSPLHDLSTIAETLNGVAAARPDVGFVFVGPTADQLVDAGVSRALLGNSVLAMGLVRHERVPSILRGADIFWAALSNRHGSPLKVFEYMSLGRSVAMAAEGSGVDPIVEARAGVVVGKGDVVALREAVITRIDDRELRAAEGERGSVWIEAKGTWSRVAEQVVDLAARVMRS